VIVRGLLAGVVGTAAMTAYQELVGRLRVGEPREEPRSEAEAWEQAPAPAKVARLALERVTGRTVSAERIPLLTNVMHWGYGKTWGLGYAVLRRGDGSRPLAAGLLFGTGVWAASYAQLVPLGIYEPPWKYSGGELALDLSYHLVYGVGVASAYAALG
jgi:uncharacterized membrane protein YagU involved in acid resistance